MKKYWGKYAFEFLSIFIAVISAFALNNWNDNRRDQLAESKILLTILDGLQKDSADVAINIMGHQQGIEACVFWRKVVQGQTPSTDSLQHYYFTLTRDLISIQNASGYETLKSRGFEIIRNDSLRMDIISLYEYDYQILQKMEEEYHELQFQENYFKEINRVIASYFNYNTTGNIVGIELPVELRQAEQKVLLSYLWKIDVNRRFILHYYKDIEEKIGQLRQKIQQELKQ